MLLHYNVIDMVLLHHVRAMANNALPVDGHAGLTLKMQANPLQSSKLALPLIN